MGTNALKPLVLFLCTRNSARSQMAEAILRDRAGDRFEVASAGLQPVGVHALTVLVLNEIGLPTDGLRSKPTTEFVANVMVRFAIIVCEHSEPSCPRICPFAGRTLHWPFEDPAAFIGDEETKLAKFREVRNRIAQRIDEWLADPESHT